jgi:glutamine synthetase
MRPDADLVAFVYSDLTGVVRGRSFPARDLERRRSSGVGWVPANQALTPFGSIAEPNPFGSVGDLRLLPVADGHVRVGPADGASAFHVHLCGAVTTDGEPWDCCPRAFLGEALDDLRRESGLRVLASFEHEFQLVSDEPPDGPFSLAAQRRIDPFASVLMDALEEAKAEPEAFLPEYGPHQFEVPCRPAVGLAAADRSVIVKEVVREVARRLGHRATFAPLTHPQAVGNGVHIHMSLVDGDLRPVGYDAERPAGLSVVAEQFAAGIVRHARALTALTAPSAISCLRLTPHRWSAGSIALAERDREALLRVPPVIDIGDEDAAAQHNLEYRAADATASPHLALGALVRAGLEGIRERLTVGEQLDADATLPTSLPDALAALESDGVARGWLAPRLLDTYLAVKRAELAALEGLDDAARCSRYVDVY